jgi:hypothetical protein
VSGDQLRLDLDAAARRESALIESLLEPDMSQEEADAVVADARRTSGWTPRKDHRPTPVPTCQCDRPLEMPNGWVAATTWARCGRWPRGAGRP